MIKPRVVLLSCGEAVYPGDFFTREQNEFIDGLKKLDVEIAQKFLIIDEDSASKTAREISLKGVDLIIVHFISWHITPYVMSSLKEAKDIPILAYSAGGRTDANGKLHSPAGPAAITAFLPVLKAIEYKYKAVYQRPDGVCDFAEIERYARVAATYHKLKNSRVGFIGYADMGLYTCAYDKLAVYKQFGIETEDYFSYEIGQLMENCPENEVLKQAEDIKSKFIFENEVSDRTLDKVLRLYLALKGKCDQNDLSAISIKCVTGVTKHMGINPCMAQSLLACKDMSVICECDAMGLITTMMLSAISGKTSTFLEHYEFFDDEILIGTCGFLPYDLADGEAKARSANLGDFFVGMGNVSKMKEGVVTMARLVQAGEKFKMFLTKGEAKSPPKWTELGWHEPSPDFPSLLVKPEMPVQQYMENVPGQHIIIVYGDYTQEMTDLCKLTGVEIMT